MANHSFLIEKCAKYIFEQGLHDVTAICVNIN